MYEKDGDNYCATKAPDDIPFINGDTCDTTCEDGNAVRLTRTGLKCLGSDALCARYFLRNYQGYKYKLCVKSCPRYTTLSGQCVSECSESDDGSSVLYSQNATCLQQCPDWFHDEDGECMPTSCDADQPFLEMDGSCSETCATRVFREIRIEQLNKSAYVCISECDYYVVRDVFSDTEMSKCVPRVSCAAPTPLLVADSLECVARCPRTKFLLMESRICVTQCPYFHYYDDATLGSVCI